MIKCFQVLAFGLVFGGFSFGQAIESSAPIKWTKYRISDHRLTILLPKLPVFSESKDVCRETETSEYWAYANDAVYGLRIVKGTRTKAPRWCTERAKFTRQTLQDRIQKLKSESHKSSDLSSPTFGQAMIRIDSKGESRWLFDDLENQRWVELSVTSRPDSPIENADFVASLKAEKTKDGIDIGNGSPQTLGDSPVVSKEVTQIKPEAEPIVSEFRLVARVRARYTDDARSENVQGTVTLRVVFLANGGIGPISVIQGLPNGLTEQAIIAARKMAFLPKKINGAPMSTSRPVTFSFNIY